MYENIFKDVTIYRLFITQTINQVTETYQVYESNDLATIQQVQADYQAIAFFKNVTYQITAEDVFHSTIEDGYYTFSHIFETGHKFNFSLYTMLHDRNIAEIITSWFELIVHFQTQVTHFSVQHIAFANSADGATDFSLIYDNENPQQYYGTYTDFLVNDSVNPAKYTWQVIPQNIPIKVESRFSFVATVTVELEQVLGKPQAINKRDRRNDNWNYAPNSDYPFIGGYES